MNQWKIGTQKELHSHESISFHQEGYGVFIEGDPVNLFAVNAAGRRYFLGHFTNSLLFQFPPFIAGKGMEIIAVSEGKTTLWEWKVEELQQQCASNPEDAAALAQQIDAWSRTLWKQISPSKPKTTTDISTFVREFSHALPLFIERVDDEDRVMVSTRTREEAEKLEGAFEQLKAVLTAPPLEEISGAHDPLVRACQVLAHFLKIELKIPKEVIFAGNDEEKLELICEASQIRKRKIVLTPEFFTQDQGPLIGFLGHEKVAVALIPSVGYRLIDDSGPTHVTAGVASKLSSMAFMLYVPFPPSVKSGRETFWFLCKQQGSAIASLVLLTAMAISFAFIPAVATKSLFNDAIPDTDTSLVLRLTFGMICAGIGAAGFFFLRDLLLLKIEGLSAHLVNTGLWDRLLKLSPSFFRRYTVGDLYWRLNSVDEMRRQVGLSGTALFLTGVFSFLYLCIMAIYSVPLTAIAAGNAFFGLLVTIGCGMWKVRVLSRSYEIQARMRGLLVQIIGGIGKLRTVGAEKNAFAHWASLFARNKLFQMTAQNIQNAVTALSVFLPIFSLWIIFGYVDFYRDLSMPDFLAFNIAFGSFTLAVYPALTTWMTLVNQAPLWKRAQVILEEPIEQKHEGVRHEMKGEVEIDSVVFGYDPHLPPVLNGITISVRPQEFIGIVGSSGCGKSTLVRLLLGFEIPYSGAIYYDRKNLVHLDMREMRKQIGVVFQGEGIISGNLYDNIVCGGQYSKEQVIRALKLSGFMEDLASMPMGLHTIIPVDGGALSGGQKQRLLLARALISSPTLLIFDEATSALDNKTQEEVSANIAQLRVTRIVIAQRLSTIRKADRIYVLDKGIITQVGTFEELAKTPGLFAEMLKRQQM